MSATEQDKEDVAAVGFMAILLLCAGWAGVFVAAVAVGAQRAWSGRDGNGGTSPAWEQRVKDHRAWLDADRRRQAEWRQARRDWWAAGADPDSKPAQPSTGTRLASWLHRRWSKAALRWDKRQDAVGRFAKGCSEGWNAAQVERRNGAGFKDIVRARPGDVSGDVADEELEIPETRSFPDDEEEWHRPAGTPTPDDRATAAPDPEPQPTPEPAKPATEPQITPEPNQQEEPMTTPTNTQAAAPTGETNLDYTVADLAGIKGSLAQVSDLNDHFANVRQQLIDQVNAAQERATANGGTAATVQALDEARAVVNLIGEHLIKLSDATEDAMQQTDAAELGLAPARDAQDALHASGATGRFVDVATD